MMPEWFKITAKSPDVNCIGNAFQVTRKTIQQNIFPRNN